MINPLIIFVCIFLEQLRKDRARPSFLWKKDIKTQKSEEKNMKMNKYKTVSQQI